MTIYFTIALMSFTVIFFVLFPLWRRRADKPLGWGLEMNKEVADWDDQKNRLTQQLTELDLALTQKKLDPFEYEKEKETLLKQADKTFEALQQAGNATHSPPPNYIQRTYPLFGIICGIGFVVATTGLTAFLGNQPIKRNVSPHVAGQMSLTDKIKAMKTADKASPHKHQKASPHKQMQGKPPVMGADGKPDIQAMVARLEARVQKPDASLKDIMMLAKSFNVLGRKEDAIKLYERAVALAPDDMIIALTAGQYITQSSDKAVQLRGEALFDKILQEKPNFPEAMWLKSLSLLRRHKVEEAKDLLTKLTPLVDKNPPAKKAVADLFATLDKTRKPE